MQSARLLAPALSSGLTLCMLSRMYCTHVHLATGRNCRLARACCQSACPSCSGDLMVLACRVQPARLQVLVQGNLAPYMHELFMHC